MTALELLKKYYGYTTFRPGQEAVISAILSGRDTLAVMPTGAGKSICFQIPALLMPGITLVISPLISLMRDQVLSLVANGIPAAFLNSSLNAGQTRTMLSRAREGRYKIIYVAPERLAMPEFLDFARGAQISMLTADEAHCISQWGQDFRPSYLKVADFVSALPSRPLLCAFTATATREVSDDIQSSLQLHRPFVSVMGFNRENLYFEVQKPADKYRALNDYLLRNPDKGGIIYCLTRKTVEQVCFDLQEDGWNATRYHAGLSEEERSLNQDDFLFDRKAIIVATNAFGMGIDKSNVRFVVHYNMPKDMESYYQEAGRAGRDGAPADCILLYSGQDIMTNQFLIDRSSENSEQDPAIIEELRKRDRERLRRMANYCHTPDCLRQAILDYFGDRETITCGNCSNCQATQDEVDITAYSRQILTCLSGMGERFGLTILIDTLRGSKNERILRLGLNKLILYGALRELSAAKMREIVNYLILRGYITQTDDEYPIAKLTERARDVLYNGASVFMRLAAEEPKKPKKEKAKKLAHRQELAVNERLFALLREKRSQLAAEKGVPAYVVFADSALIDMCKKLPQDEDAFLEVSGVGAAKLEQYGQDFLCVLREWNASGENDTPQQERFTPAQQLEAVHSAYLPSTEPIPISDFAEQVNALLLRCGETRIPAVSYTNYLLQEGYLQLRDGKRLASESGEALGISSALTQKNNGEEYYKNLYNENAQRFLLTLLEKLLQDKE